MKDATKCLHAGYEPKNTEPRVMPIVQSTTYVYDSTADVAAVFDDPTRSLIYSRFANPTVMAVEEKIAALGYPGVTSLSIGAVSCGKVDQPTFKRLYSEADKVLYEAKMSGKRRYVIK